MSPLVLYAVLPVFTTFLGGFIVYRWKRDLHPWLSLSGGVMLGVAFLDLLPEAIERGEKTGVSLMYILGSTLVAIMFFLILDKIFGAHHHEHGHDEPHEPCENDDHKHRGALARAGGMIFHSLFDGLAIGTGFAADAHLGFLITLAVIMHDFSDGMSTVTVLKDAFGDKHRYVLWLLIADALAPFIGTMIGLRTDAFDGALPFMLAAFAGLFLFLSLSDLLPKAHAKHAVRGITLTLIGIGLVGVFRALAPV